jgi:hypothetical protein
MKTFCTLRWVLAVCVFVIPVSSQTEPPVLTLDGGDGISATLSDYSLTNVGPAPNGGFQSTYCFTLTNTSSEEFYVGAVGLLAAVPADRLVVTSSTGPFGYSQFDADNYFEELPVTAVHIANGFPDILTSSIAPGNSGSFCMTFTSTNSLTLEGLVNRTLVLFGDEVNAMLPGCVFVSDPTRRIGVAITTFQTEGRTCFIARNVGDQTVTGFAFEAPNPISSYQLFSIVPNVQPNGQMFEFASPVPYSLRNGRGFDFGFLTGPDLTSGIEERGLEPGEATSLFCVNGTIYPDDGMTSSIELPTEVWFQGRPRRAVFSRYKRYCPAGALRGTVSTAPR